jgi:hypothetical protein
MASAYKRSYSQKNDSFQADFDVCTRCFAKTNYSARTNVQIRICASVTAGAATSVIAGADPQSINNIEQAKLLFRQLNVGHKAAFVLCPCKAQNAGVVVLRRGFATQ